MAAGCAARTQRPSPPAPVEAPAQPPEQPAVDAEIEPPVAPAPPLHPASSPLENLVPDEYAAKPKRRHESARYIASMHRRLHDGWTWGFLDLLDARSSEHPFNDFELWTRVEIVVDRDGTLRSVTTVHESGKPKFDEAAREVVKASGPFGEPPPELMSADGHAYFHWAFHRDERACSAMGADEFILDANGAGDRPDPHAPVRGR